MQDRDQHIIAREGWPLLAVLLLLALLAHASLGAATALVCLLLVVPVAFVFRNPACTVPAVPLAVVSPICGKLVSMRPAHDPWLERDALRFRMHITLLDVHAVRSPIEGKIMKQWASELDGGDYRRRHSWWIQTDEGDDVVVSLAVGRMAPFVKLRLQTGERIGQGQLCGFFYFAGVVDIFMPARSRIEAAAGERVVAGTTILGRFIHTAGTGISGK